MKNVTSFEPYKHPEPLRQGNPDRAAEHSTDLAVMTGKWDDFTETVPFSDETQNGTSVAHDVGESATHTVVKKPQ